MHVYIPSEWDDTVYETAMANERATANENSLVLNEVEEHNALILTAGYSIWELKI